MAYTMANGILRRQVVVVRPGQASLPMLITTHALTARTTAACSLLILPLSVHGAILWTLRQGGKNVACQCAVSIQGMHNHYMNTIHLNVFVDKTCQYNTCYRVFHWLVNSFVIKSCIVMESFPICVERVSVTNRYPACKA